MRELPKQTCDCRYKYLQGSPKPLGDQIFMLTLLLLLRKRLLVVRSSYRDYLPKP